MAAELLVVLALLAYGEAAVAFITGASDLFQGMSLGEADEIRMGETYFGPFVDRSGGPYRNRAAQAAIAQFAYPILLPASARRCAGSSCCSTTRP